MVKFKNVIFITAIGLLVLFSGCAGTQDGKVSETAKPIHVVQTPPVQTSSYQIQVTEAKNLQVCVWKNTQMIPCTLVSIEFSNNNKESIDLKLNKEAIVTKDGRQLFGVIDERGTSMNPTCNYPRPSFSLFPGARKNLNVCYPLVSKEDNPILYIGVMVDKNEQKEFKFDLTKSGITD